LHLLLQQREKVGAPRRSVPTPDLHSRGVPAPRSLSSGLATLGPRLDSWTHDPRSMAGRRVRLRHVDVTYYSDIRCVSFIRSRNTKTGGVTRFALLNDLGRRLQAAAPWGGNTSESLLARECTCRADVRHKSFKVNTLRQQ
jgi:hypothetical protein